MTRTISKNETLPPFATVLRERRERFTLACEQSILVSRPRLPATVLRPLGACVISPMAK